MIWNQLHSRIRKIRHDQTGLTLVEMLTVIVLLTAILAIAFTELIQTQKVVRGTSNRLQQTQSAKTGIEAMSKTLSTAIAPGLIGANDLSSPTDASGINIFLPSKWDELTFYANLNNPSLSGGKQYAKGLSLVTYKLVGTNLIEIIRPDRLDASSNPTRRYCATGDTDCTVRERIIAANIVNSDTAGNRLFTFYDKDGNSIDQADVTATDAVKLNEARSIEVNLSSRAGKLATDVAQSTVRTKISLTNVYEDSEKFPPRNCGGSPCPTPTPTPGPALTPRGGPPPTPKPPGPGESS